MQQKLIKYLLNLRDAGCLKHLEDLKGMEILLEAKALSKRGKIDSASLPDLLDQLGRSGFSRILLIDLLVKEGEFQAILDLISGLPGKLEAIRFLDPGLGRAIQKQWPALPLELSLEQGIPNQGAICSWVESFGGKLRRLALSNQIPIAEITELRERLGPGIQLELLALGRIETFYSPRPLVQPLFGGGSPLGEFQAASEDRPTQINPLVQNEHGTLMYHDKDLWLLGEELRAQQAGITHFRLELEGDEQYELVEKYWDGSRMDPTLHQAWKRKTTRGFFLKNRTDKPLKRLKNTNLQSLRGQEVAEVIDSKKNGFVIFELKEKLSLPLNLKLCNPEGREIPFKLKEVWNLHDNVDSSPLREMIPPGIYRTGWIKAGLRKSLILKDER